MISRFHMNVSLNLYIPIYCFISDMATKPVPRMKPVQISVERESCVDAMHPVFAMFRMGMLFCNLFVPYLGIVGS
jgi:hypothetical protein